MIKVGDTLYRFVFIFDTRYLEHWTVHKITPKGLWIRRECSFGFEHSNRWMKYPAVRPFAHPTEKQALYSFIRKRLRQIKIIDLQLERSRAALCSAEKEYLECHRCTIIIKLRVFTKVR